MGGNRLGLWMFFFGCGFMFINYPFIKIFDKVLFIFKIPLLYFYFFVGWILSILVIYLFVRFFLKHED